MTGKGSSDGEDPENNRAPSGSGRGAKLLVAAGGAGFAVWGLCKLLGSSSSSKQQELPQEKIGGRSNYNNNNIPQTPTPIAIKCKKPAKEWFKLNTDASFFKDSSEAVGGGLIRDEAGHWIAGFTVRLTSSCWDSTSAEMQALKQGLVLAIEKGMRRLEVETDSEQAINHIQNADQIKTTQNFHSIAEECSSLMGHLWEIRIKHVHRDLNKCAHALADMHLLHPNEQLKKWDNPPEKIRNWVSTEMNYY